MTMMMVWRVLERERVTTVLMVMVLVMMVIVMMAVVVATMVLMMSCLSHENRCAPRAARIARPMASMQSWSCFPEILMENSGFGDGCGRVAVCIIAPRGNTFTKP